MHSDEINMQMCANIYWLGAAAHTCVATYCVRNMAQ